MMQYYQLIIESNKRIMASQIFTLLQLPKNHPDVSTLKFNNPLLLPYIILASKQTCFALKIQKYAYRLITNEENQANSCLALIILSSSVQNKCLYASENIIKRTGSEVYIKRINLGVFNYDNPVVVKMKNFFRHQDTIDEMIQNSRNRLANLSIFPKLPYANEVCLFLNEKSDIGSFMAKFLGQSMVLIPTKADELVLDIDWIHQNEINKESYELSSKFIRIQAENKKQKYRCYLKILLKGILSQGQNDRWGYCLLEPTKTKINIMKASHYQLDNFPTKILLPKLYQSIYSQNICFKKLISALSSQFEEKPDKKLILFRGAKSMGLCSLVHEIAQRNSYYFVKINCEQFVKDSELYRQISRCEDYGSSVIYVKNVDWLIEIANKTDRQEAMKHLMRKLEQTLEKMGDKSLESFILIVNYQGSAIKFDMTKNAVLQIFEPSKQEKVEILETVLREHIKNTDYQIEFQDPREICNLLANTLGWKKFDLVIKNLSRTLQKEKIIKIDEILKQTAKFMQVQKVENIKNVGWDDVGGLKDAKQEIIQTILLPTKHPEIFDEWIKPRTGILFFGPPGTGKTMLGKCIANECKMGFISVKGPQLLNMYIGESEKNVREVFQRANSNKPCIIFMDQLDALIPKRGQSSDSNQVMDRIVSELLSQMDRAAGNGVFVIGATNRPDLLDPSILRPGRFDKQIYLGILNDQNSRKQVLQAQTRHLTLRQGFEFERVLQKVPMNFTGADFYGLTSRSILKGAERFIERFEAGLQKKQNKVILIQEDFIEIAQEMKPSVSPEELKHYEQLRQQYK